MKTAYIALCACILIASACKKTTCPEESGKLPGNHPEMMYTDLQNREMKRGQPQFIDLNKDGSNDISFGTWYIGDPLEREDEILYFAHSYVHSNLLAGEVNNSPIFKAGNIIPVGSSGMYEWYQVAMIDMARKNIGEEGPPYWELDWKQVSHKYLAVQVVKEEKRYNGWVELSFNTATETLTLHRAAVSKEPEKDIMAGR